MQKIHNIFYLLLLKKNIFKKKKVNKNIIILDFKASDNKKYKIKII